MPDSRGLLFVVNERQRRWWLEEERRAMYARADAPPLPSSRSGSGRPSGTGSPSGFG